MKKLISAIVLLALALALCACGGQQPAGTTAAVPAEHTGITFETDPVWRQRSALLETPNTFEAWVKLPSGKTGTDDVIISNFGNAYDFSSMPYVTLRVEPSGAVVLDWVVNEELGYHWNFNDVNLRNDQWSHLAVVRDVEAGRIRCYVDGQLADEYNERYSMDLLPCTAYCVGGDHTHKNENRFGGEISSVAVFSTARTQEQIQKDMTAPEGDGLLFAYRMDEAKDGTVEDLSGNGRTLIASTRWFTEKEAVTDYAYSFMVVPDTQIVSAGDPQNFHKIYDYIVENVEKRNVKFVIGLGDITNNDTYEEWSNVKKSIFLMDGVVPYSLVRGNNVHDSVAKFKEAFPMEKYADRVKGSFEGDMRNVYYTFEVGQVPYLVLVLDCSPTDEMISWASDVVAANPDRNVIVTTHVYMNKDGTPMSPTDFAAGTPNTGDDIWEGLVRKHENIVMVLSGHDSSAQIAYSTQVGDKGNTVTQLLLDGQGVEDSQEGSAGFVATFYFSEDGKDVTVEYYSTIRQQYFLTENQFSFSLDLID